MEIYVNYFPTFMLFDDHEMPSISKWFLDAVKLVVLQKNKAIKDGGIAPWKDLNKEKR